MTDTSDRVGERSGPPASSTPPSGDQLLPPAPIRRSRPAAAPGAKILKPLSNPNFALFWGGLTISLLGDGMFFVALPLQVLALRNDAGALMLVLLAWNLPSVAFLLFGGVLSDRMDRRHMLVLSVLIQGAAILGIGLLARSGSLQLWHFYPLAVIYGVGEALFGPAYGSIVPDLVPRDQLVQANALDNFSRPLALRIAGPAFGGIVIALVGLGAAFIVDAATFGLAALAFMAIHLRRKPAVGPRGMVGAEIKEGFAYIRRKPWLWATLLSAATGQLAFFGAWWALVPFTVSELLLGGETGYSIVVAVGGLGALAASIFMGSRELPRRYMTNMYLAMATGTLMLAGFGLARELWHAVVASFVLQSFFTAGVITWGSTMHRLVPGNILGRVASVDWMVSTSLIPLSLLITAPAAEFFGTRTTLVGAGVLGFVGVLAFLLVPGVRSLEQSERLKPATDLES